MSLTSSVTGFNPKELLKRFTAPLLITLILLASHLSFGILDSLGHLMTAILASFLTEAILHRFLFGSWRDLSSAYISGISAGILIRSPLYWPFALCAMLSISSKYVFRYNGRHIWNPTNFGVVMILLFASDYAAVLSIQWGSQMWAMLVIWIVGLVTVYRASRFHISAVYVLSFFFFGWIRSWITGDPYLAEISAITGPMYQLFVLFMITDPKTTVRSRNGRMWVAFMIALVEFALRLSEAVYAPFYALFLVGPVAMVLEDLWTTRNRPRSESTHSL
ncbi:MAG: hypothetical protein WD115_00660 [Balneolaceae bacterium]